MKQNRNYPMDERLESQDQIAISKVVASLADEEPSLAWRSQLNEKLMAVSVQQKKRRTFRLWTLRPALGLSVAGALALGLFFSGGRPAVAGGNLESALISEHQAASDVAQVSYIDLHNSEGISSASSVKVESPEWSETDTESI